MIKYTILLINVLALVFVRVFFPGDVQVKMQITPQHLKTGETLTISFTINKGSIAGVGHMKQELPPVFGNATVIDAKGAEFKYLAEDNVVKFTWISLPADQEFVISFKVTVNADAPDSTVNLGGKFSYVLNNEKQTYSVNETPVIIENKTPVIAKKDTITPVTTQSVIAATTGTEPKSTVAPVNQAATSIAKTDTAPATITKEETAASVTTNRIIVGKPEAGTEFTVEVNVKKGVLKGFARIQEMLPAGLTARALDNKGGSFSFRDQKLKIIWDNLPVEEDIKISYRVAVSDTLSGEITITGDFSYVENDDPKKAVIASTVLSVKEKTTLAATLNNTTDTKNTNAAKDTVPPASTAIASVIPSPENTMNFKVQICALSKIQRGTSYFESKFAINDKVSMEFHEGWKKYIVGKYNQYKEARDYRESIRSKGVENPFVVAYNKGKRITVQEALMVSSQQWIR